MSDIIMFGEANVEPPQSVNKNVSLDEILEIAKQIWNKVKVSKVDKEDHSGNEKLLGSIQAEFKDFNTSFPLVLRWMVQMRAFSVKSMKKYLVFYASTKIDSRLKFLETQAEYLVILYRAQNEHLNERSIQQYKELIIKQLHDEDKIFIEMHEQVKVEMDAQEKSIDVDRRKRLFEYLLANKVIKE